MVTESITGIRQASSAIGGAAGEVVAGVLELELVAGVEGSAAGFELCDEQAITRREIRRIERLMTHETPPLERRY